MRTVPVALPLGAALLKDEVAVGAEDVVSVAEVLVEHHGSRGDPLMAVFAAGFVGVVGFVFGYVNDFCGAGEGGSTERVVGEGFGCR